MAQLELPVRTWGGRRDGAGRKPAAGRRAVPHRRRATHDRHCPVHVTLRASDAVPSLRHGRIFIATRNALAAATSERFRVLHFSVQGDHLHLLVEADEPTGFARGVRGLAIRVAKAVNRALGRHGRVWGDRYHAHMLRTPREVRNALVYVLQNVRKHVPAARGLDPCSSARWFDGWLGAPARIGGPSPVATARTWLARVGWRRRGLIDPGECPRAVRPDRPGRTTRGTVANRR
jgi:REP element-mobilizing transposase RayT